MLYNLFICSVIPSVLAHSVQGQKWIVNHFLLVGPAGIALGSKSLGRRDHCRENLLVLLNLLTSSRAKRILRRHERQRTASTAAADQPLESFDDAGNEAPPVEATNNDSRVTTDGRVTHPSVDYGEAESTLGIVQKICELGRQHIDEQATSAIPGYRASTSSNCRTTASHCFNTWSGSTTDGYDAFVARGLL
jgi:hypothetical protein